MNFSSFKEEKQLLIKRPMEKLFHCRQKSGKKLSKQYCTTILSTCISGYRVMKHVFKLTIHISHTLLLPLWQYTKQLPVHEIFLLVSNFWCSLSSRVASPASGAAPSSLASVSFAWARRQVGSPETGKQRNNHSRCNVPLERCQAEYVIRLSCIP